MSFDKKPIETDPMLAGITIYGVERREGKAMRKVVLEIKRPNEDVRVPVYCDPEHSKNVIKNLRRLLR